MYRVYNPKSATSMSKEADLEIKMEPGKKITIEGIRGAIEVHHWHTGLSPLLTYFHFPLIGKQAVIWRFH